MKKKKLKDLTDKELMELDDKNVKKASKVKIPLIINFIAIAFISFIGIEALSATILYVTLCNITICSIISFYHLVKNLYIRLELEERKDNNQAINNVENIECCPTFDEVFPEFIVTNHINKKQNTQYRR